MSQTWQASPLLASSDTLATSRGYINDAFAALRSSFSGTSAPTSPAPMAGQLFYNTSTNVLQIYNGTAWVTIGDADSAYLGLLPLSAGSSYALSGDLYCGSNNLVNVADPTAAQHGATKNYVDTNFLQLAGGTMTGNLTMGTNEALMTNAPTVGAALCNKTYTDAKAVAGGTFTAAIDMDDSYQVTGLPAPSASSDATRKAYVDDFFDTLTGHDHDGADGKQIPWANIDTASSGPHEQYLDYEDTSVHSGSGTLCTLELPAVNTGESWFVEGFCFFNSTGACALEIREGGTAITGNSQIDNAGKCSLKLAAMVTPSSTTTYTLYSNLIATCYVYYLRAVKCIDES